MKHQVYRGGEIIKGEKPGEKAQKLSNSGKPERKGCGSCPGSGQSRTGTRDRDSTKEQNEKVTKKKRRDRPHVRRKTRIGSSLRKS